MKINNVYKVGIKGSQQRVSAIENYLEREIFDILDKKRFDDDEYHYRGQPKDSIVSKLRNLNLPEKSRHEEYLPFNKEEIRPIIRDGANSDRMENLILESLMPNIEHWLDENLERVVNRIVRRYIAKKAMLAERRDSREERRDSERDRKRRIARSYRYRD